LITGAESNKFAKVPTAAELDALGLRLAEAPSAVKDPRIISQVMQTIDGRPIPVDKLFSYILEKK